MSTFWLLLFESLLQSVLIMTLTWALARRINNYSIVDVAWTLSFFLQSLVFLLATEGWWVRRAMILVLVGIWSLRLGIFILRRVYQKHPAEDERYRIIRLSFGPRAAAGFFRFFNIKRSAWWLSRFLF